MTQTIAPRLRTLVLLLLAAACALLAGAGPASAHAALTGSDPREGAVVDEAPAQVSLTFSESVSMDDDALRVLDPRGERVDDGKPSGTGGATYSVKLHAGLPDGTYTVTYQVVSADSHPVAGAYTFSVGAPSETSVAVSGQSAGGGFVGGLYGVGRYVSYTGFAVLVGGAAFVLACWPRGSGVRVLQRVVVSGWLALTAATLLLLLLRGSYTGSGRFADVFDLNLLGEVLQTKPGAALVSRLLLLAAAALFIAVLFGAYDKREDEEKRDLTFGLAVGGSVVAAGLAATWAMSEHASVGLQAGLAMPVDVVHLIAVATWLGGLTALLVALYRGPADTPVPAPAVRRFSRVAFGSVIALVVTGTYQSWRQLGSWTAFTDTRYGQLLLVKIGLVAVLVGVAHFSRRWTAQLAEAAPAVAGAAAARRAEKRAGKASTKASGNAKVAQKTSSTTKGSGTTKGTGTAKGSGGSPRAAQLARQRAAVDAARQKRQRDADPNRFGLRRSVLAEAGIAVVLLVVTTVLTQTEPGRTEEEAKAAGGSSAAASAPSTGAVTLDMPFDTGAQNGKGVVRVELDPARVGANDMHLYVERPDGTAFDLPEVKVALTQKAKSIGPLPVAPDHITTGHWSASGVQIPMAGDWEVAVTVRTSDIDQVTISKNTQIG
ncbi:MULTISPECIES: copper resistance CopC/CopD family protein [Streptomyces violaceoruber group]|uniref:Copper resistance protein CopC n=1 Tax=Streptomyces rubrogriseus TaxID=194673 RepID=A0ABT4NW96_9ACTN|nr:MULTISPECIES: copper resistance protein CopC [Streptomyces anthocyanicus group]MCW8117121.1 copper resistance protein CopC [Streptomyces anthocyanicus]MCZ4633383.1 copper resistance protein CopC [Streptomyces rubrogriseus]